MKPTIAMLLVLSAVLAGCIPTQKKPSVCHAMTMTVDEYATYEKLPQNQQKLCAINVYDPSKEMDGITLQ